MSVQNRYNLVDRGSEDVLDFCHRSTTSASFPWFPLATGLLVQPGGPLVADRRRANGATPSQIALAWLLHHSPVMLPIPGTSKVEHLEENTTAGLITLDERTKRELELHTMAP